MIFTGGNRGNGGLGNSVGSVMSCELFGAGFMHLIGCYVLINPCKGMNHKGTETQSKAPNPFHCVLLSDFVPLW